MSEHWAHDYEVRVTRTIETVYIVNAKDEQAAEVEGRSLDESAVAISRGLWAKRFEEIVTEAVQIT